MRIRRIDRDGVGATLAIVGLAVACAIVFTVALEAFREFGAFRLVNFAVVLVLIMIYRPQGLLGSWTLFKGRRRALARASTGTPS